MILRSFCMAIALVIPLTAGADNSPLFQDISDLRQQVKQYLQTQFNKDWLRDRETEKTVNIAVGRLDPRLRLKQCDKALTFELQDNGNPGGNVAVKTRCDGSTLWSIFVQAQITMSVPVTVAKHNLARGTVLQSSDLAQAALESHSLATDYVADPDRIIGKELSRPVKRGNAIRLANLLEPKVIKRGDAVIIEAKSDLIFVATPGTALSDGKQGQQIRVRNERSRQEIKVEVIGPGRVRVLM